MQIELKQRIKIVIQNAKFISKAPQVAGLLHYLIMNNQIDF